MNENVKLPFVISNIELVKNSLPKSVKFGYVMKGTYVLLKHVNIPYFAQRISTQTNSVNYFIFSLLSNAILARQFGITQPILLIYPITPEEAILASKYNIEVDCPCIEWLQKVSTLIKTELKVHVWFDSGLSREGIIDENILYELLKNIPNYSNIKLVGLATKFNPDTKGIFMKSYRLKDIPLEQRTKYYQNLIQGQIDKFNNIVNTCRQNSYISKDVIIHAGCSNEVFAKVIPAYYDMVRVGTLIHDSILNDFNAKAEIVLIKTIPKDFCMGYYCKNGHTPNEIKVAYIKYYGILNADYKYKDHILSPIESGDPFGLIINDIDDIKVGDFIDIHSTMLFTL